MPGIFIGLVAAHLFLVVWHGISAPPEKLSDADIKAPNWKEKVNKRYKELKAQGKSFFPHIVAKDTIAIAILFVTLLALALKYGAILEDMADPTSADYDPRPEWYFLFLFQALKYFPGWLEVVATVVLPGAGVTLLFLLPFVDGGPARHPLQRKGWTALGVSVLAVVVFLTAQGLAVPNSNFHFDRNPQVVKGKELYAQLRCANCHSIGERGGVLGPTLDNAASRRGREWIADHFRKPQSKTPGSPMPNYKLLDEEVEALTEYIISLEGGPYTKNAPALYDTHCLDCHTLAGRGDDDTGPDLSEVGRKREQGWIAQYIRDPSVLYPETEMDPFNEELSEEEIEDLSRYLSAQRGGKVPAYPTEVKKKK